MNFILVLLIELSCCIHFTIGFSNVGAIYGYQQSFSRKNLGYGQPQIVCDENISRFSTLIKTRYTFANRRNGKSISFTYRLPTCCMSANGSYSNTNNNSSPNQTEKLYPSYHSLTQIDTNTFARYNRLHHLLRHLQTSLPSILYKPIGNPDGTEEDTEKELQFYSPDFQLVAITQDDINDDEQGGSALSSSLSSSSSSSSLSTNEDEIILLSSRNELITMSRALALATSIAKRASDLLTSAISGRNIDLAEGSSLSPSSDFPVVNCSFYLDFPNSKSATKIDIRKDPDTHQWIINESPLGLGFETIYVRWSSSLPSLLSDTVYTNKNDVNTMQFSRLNLNPPEISGISQLVLDTNNSNGIDTLQITKHRLISVDVDGRTVPIATIAEALLRLRGFAQSSSAATVASSILPTFDNLFANLRGGESAVSPIPFLFKELRDGVIAPLLQSSSFQSKPTEAMFIPPIYLWNGQKSFSELDMILDKLDFDILDDGEIMSIDNVSIHPTKMNTTFDYENTIPVPGSKTWTSFAMFYRHVTKSFLPKVIPFLSSKTKRKSVASLFSPKVDFRAIDGTTIFSSSEDVAQFYTTLTLLRKAVSSIPSTLTSSTTTTASTWNVTNVSMVRNANGDFEQVLVSWKSTLPLLLPLPFQDALANAASFTLNGNEGNESRKSSLLPISGQDLFTMKLVSYGSAEDKIGSVHPKYIITGIQQRKFAINGNLIENPETWKSMVRTISQMDGQKFATNIGGGSNSNGGRAISTAVELLTDIWELSTSTSAETSDLEGMIESRELNSDAAASVYKFMRILHFDLPSLLDRNSSNQLLKNKVVPGEEYLSHEVKLKGFLKETLSRDLIGYRQAIGLSLSSLRTALQSNRVVIENGEKIMTNVELTDEGNVQFRVMLPLQVKALINFDNLGFFNVATSNGDNRIPNSVPLKIELLSLYIIDENGLVSEHHLLESRVNGVLTPADVVSRWVQRMMKTDITKGRGPSSNVSPDALNLLKNPILNVILDVVDRNDPRNR